MSEVSPLGSFLRVTAAGLIIALLVPSRASASGGPEASAMPETQSAPDPEPPAAEPALAPVPADKGAPVLTPAGASSPAPAHPSAEPAFRRRGPYLYTSPAGVMTAGLLLYTWGLGAGVMLPRRNARLLTIGGFVDHGVEATPRPRSSILTAGAELRIGRARSRVYGYGVFRVGGEVIFDFRSSVVTGAGGGVQALLGRHIVIGGEALLDGLWFVRFADPDSAWEAPPVWGTLVGRVMLGFLY